MKRWLLYFLTGWFCVVNESSALAQHPGATTRSAQPKSEIFPGAYQMNEYLPSLKGKRVALLMNQTARVGERLLLDTLLSCGVKITKVFVPEHGFRGTADAGALIKNGKDERTGLPVISLYGNNKKAKAEQLQDVDVVIYDLQDVGVRFYTYISSLEYMMEACAETGKELMVLDRPNPNGHYVDGPVLRKPFKSFVGMQSIPVVYGMTAGEYAQMLVGERWVKGAEDLKLKVISCKNYDHTKRYQLPVAPSPNLKTMAAIYLYPSLCLFEGTAVSVGRGTDLPFQQWGHPDFEGKTNYYFTPKSVTGASKPLFEGKKCFGRLVAINGDSAFFLTDGKLQLDALIEAYNWYPDKGNFFNKFFENLAGTDQLRKQIISGKNAHEIREEWQSEVAAFKQIRKKYLLYKDFE